MPYSSRVLLFWGGLRGAVTLALALSLGAAAQETAPPPEEVEVVKKPATPPPSR